MAHKNSNLGARRVAIQGRPLSSEFKRGIVLVKDCFDRTKGDLREPECSCVERAAYTPATRWRWPAAGDIAYRRSLSRSGHAALVKVGDSLRRVAEFAENLGTARP